MDFGQLLLQGFDLFLGGCGFLGGGLLGPLQLLLVPGGPVGGFVQLALQVGDVRVIDRLLLLQLVGQGLLGVLCPAAGFVPLLDDCGQLGVGHLKGCFFLPVDGVFFGQKFIPFRCRQSQQCQGFRGSQIRHR